MKPNQDFYQYILPVIISGVFSLVICIIGKNWRRKNNKLASRETMETKNSDGSIIKRKIEIFK
jgi:hypothetical protein